MKNVSPKAGKFRGLAGKITHPFRLMAGRQLTKKTMGNLDRGVQIGSVRMVPRLPFTEGIYERAKGKFKLDKETRNELRGTNIEIPEEAVYFQIKLIQGVKVARTDSGLDFQEGIKSGHVKFFDGDGKLISVHRRKSQFEPIGKRRKTSARELEALRKEHFLRRFG